MIHRFPSRRLGLVISLLAIALQADIARAVVATRTVALTGRPAPGALDGANFAEFSGVGINPFGRTAFKAELSGDGINDTNNEGIWSERDGELALVARDGMQAPGTGVQFLNLGTPRFNRLGEVLFNGVLTGDNVTAANRDGLWSDHLGPLLLVAREGGQAPSNPLGAVFADLQGASFSPAGGAVFPAFLSGTGIGGSNQRAIFVQRSAVLGKVIQEGDAAPGLPNVTIDEIVSLVSINGSDRVAFAASLAGLGVNPTNNQSVWSDSTGSVALVARSGAQAPGTDANVNFAGFEFGIAINDAGQIAFRASLTGPGVAPGVNDSGVWSTAGGGLALVARTGAPAPGAPDGVVFKEFREAVINHNGHTAFQARLAGPDVVELVNDSGIWTDRGGTLEPVALAGEHAPGTADGVNFRFIPESFFINAADRVAFIASVAGPDIAEGVNDEGFWVESDAGLGLFARTGEQIEVALFDRRAIAFFGKFGSSGLEDGRLTILNDAGQIAFVAGFDDGSAGVFVSDEGARGAVGTSCGVCGAGAPFALTLAGPLLLATKRLRRRRRRAGAARCRG